MSLDKLWDIPAWLTALCVSAGWKNAGHKNRSVILCLFSTVGLSSVIYHRKSGILSDHGDHGHKEKVSFQNNVRSLEEVNHWHEYKHRNYVVLFLGLPEPTACNRGVNGQNSAFWAGKTESMKHNIWNWCFVNYYKNILKIYCKKKLLSLDSFFYV